MANSDLGARTMEKERIARLAGLGALGAAAGLLAVYAFLVYVTRPVPTGGMNATTAVVTWISLGGLFIALVVVHVVYGRLLMAATKRGRSA
jgi:hypothetical protein